MRSIPGGFGECAGECPENLRSREEKLAGREAGKLAALLKTVQPRPRAERSAWWREWVRVYVRRKIEEKGSGDWKSLLRLGRTGRLAKGAGGCPSFKFSNPRWVPLSGVPGPSLPPRCRLRVRSCQEHSLSWGRGFGVGGLSPQASAKEGVAFV